MDNEWLCPYCKAGFLGFVPECEPWHPDQYQCDKCDSVYTEDDVERLEAGEDPENI